MPRGRRPMEGRNAKGSRQPPSSKFQPLDTSLNKPDHNLRPASPPKQNPWLRPPKPSATLDEPSAAVDKPASPSLASGRAIFSDYQTQGGGSVSSTGKERDYDSLKSGESIGTDSQHSFSDHRSSPSSKAGRPASKNQLRDALGNADNNLWDHPVGGDIIVQTPDHRYMMHRSLIESKSGWVARRLRQQGVDDEPVIILTSMPTFQVGWCLKYCYSQRIEICEYFSDKPFDMGHLYRCLIIYSAAAALEMPALLRRVLELVEKTAHEFAAYLSDAEDEYLGTPYEWEMMTLSIQGTLAIIYASSHQRRMEPMRLAMAAVYDVAFSWLMRFPWFIAKMQTGAWLGMMPRISADQLRYRSMMRGCDGVPKTVVPTLAALENVLERFPMEAVE